MAIIEKKEPTYNKSYNDRLFGKGLRASLHMARFSWAENKIKLLKLEKLRVTELGCFDGRLLDHLPKNLVSYDGYDAGWEGGLASAQKNRTSEKEKFHECFESSQFNPSDGLNLFVALETLEHINDEAELDAYLAIVATKLANDGVVLVSVPNEIGPFFLVKHLLKRILQKDNANYTVIEIFWQSFGVTSKVKRHEHKGFSHRKFQKLLAKHFRVKSVEGLNSKFLPRFLNMSIGFVCEKSF